MGSEHAEDDHRSRRRDDYPAARRDSASSSRHNKHDSAEDSQRHRKRSRDRSRHRSRSPRRDHRRRSRSPDAKKRRSRSRSPRDRERERDRERKRERDRRGRGNDDSDRRHGRRQDRDRRRDPSSERHSFRKKETRQLDDSKPETNNADNKRSLIKRSGPLPSQGDTFAVSTGEEAEKPKEKPNFGNTGVLAAQSNTVTQVDGTTVTLKYHEPPEARKPAPRDQWRLYVFKGDEVIDTIELHTRSCWLVGRDLAIADLPAEHPSISKQHAVIQFRYTEKRNEYGDKMGRVKPYLIDLESANGTKLNGDKVPDSRYLELRDKDMMQFGSSTREYVLMLPPKD
ncbi:SMAD/FHA domain-containing protein [Pseudoneurospora amorphoporcata]|uniref:SMAD/FHA domain-containing protein n=1 Tax=Pseudoneurospora amorphoporcata TaxID=241081 RepID=A0AAN6NPI6_9PEZI|nr:SMAD/FHA domain-containing protein [Pseudoneurospora amorphoporcata]